MSTMQCPHAEVNCNVCERSAAASELRRLRFALREVVSEVFDIATSDTLKDARQRLLAIEASIRALLSESPAEGGAP